MPPSPCWSSPLNFFVPQLPLGILESLETVPAESRQLVSIQLSLLIAIAEEQFFRGFITNLLTVKTGFFGVILSGIFFSVYHLAVYGTSYSSLFIVMGGGIILAYAAYKTRRVSTVMAPHLLNNLASVV
jgi:membrane protease YdiL (CAAX protease family)